MDDFDTYKTVLDSRYSSNEMKHLFSRRSRHFVWRKLWLMLAEAEKELGIDAITDDALRQMREHLNVTNDDFGVVAVEEKRRKHDVMAHVHAFGIVAPAAAGIIHYGATSCYVTDNAELILMRDALDMLIPKVAKVIYNLADFALEWKSEPTLGYTHYQPAQMITVGKRVSQWVQLLMMDLENLEVVRSQLRFRGAMGTTGTQASFLEIFGGDGQKIDRLNQLLCEKAGFPACYDITYQTYPRKVDLDVANAVCGLGPTVMQIAGDIRHLANMKEMEEPFDKDQIGSSAMAYKRNPMRSERIGSLGRKLMSLPLNFAGTLASQWMERTLDDSAIRRIDIPEMFLLADAILLSLDNVSNGLVVYPKRIDAHNRAELPFMITENIIMKLVANGVSRQEAHEEIRVLSQQAAAVVKNEGGANDLVDRIKRTEFFQPVWGDIDSMMDPKLYVGRAPELVQRYAGKGGPVMKKLAPYLQTILGTETAQLHV